MFSASAAAPLVPALTNDALRHLGRTVAAAAHRDPAALAQDEDFWREIQEAFTLDRTLTNLNNGGVSPSPRVVQEAMARYLAISNEAPAVTMWQWLEPQVEEVRERLAADFGCDPEEMAITRNASEALEIVQLGIPLERGSC
jgi:isopenicillin-N epimerase